MSQHQIWHGVQPDNFDVSFPANINHPDFLRVAALYHDIGRPSTRPASTIGWYLVSSMYPMSGLITGPVDPHQCALC
jgi:UTP:GlnB (protein PII) uridylyltransferase